jgi:hypothetical protein
MGQGAEQVIKFKYVPGNIFVPPVVPASEALPGWYKKMSYGEPPSPQGRALTAKACMPFFDAMTQGYIIPLWADMYVSVEKNDNGGPEFSWRDGQTEVIAPHRPDQTKGMPIMDKALGMEQQSFKFNSPWVIQTPEGYSTLFTSPLNNVNPKFSLVSAIVATDTYPGFINFPFVWTGPPDWEGLIPMGTPVAQLIPFKRDDFRHEIGAMNEEDNLRYTSAQRAMGASWMNVYKNLWRKMTRSV